MSQWEGTFGESTYGRRWVFVWVFPDCLATLRLRPKLNLKAQWPDLQWALRAPNRPLSPHSFAHLARSGFERPFDK